MINKTKKTFLILALSFLIILQAVNSQTPQTDQIGCCTNPGAVTFSCATERLVKRDAECCPKPESGFPSYYNSNQNPNGPANSGDCSLNFFYANKGCSDVSACSLGCCCSESGGSVKPESQCKGTFHKDKTSCQDICATPKCSDGMDNDNNGCADLQDSGCESSVDDDESGGKCPKQGALCNDPSYIPKLANFEIKPVKGEKKLLLTWLDECKENIGYYEISRCEGAGCTNFVIIATLNSNTFEDASDTLSFGKTYTYKAEARYILQPAIPAIIKSGTLGDKECIDKAPLAALCLDNTPYSCSKDGKLIKSGAKCDKQKICAVINSKASCIVKPKCSDKESSPFGLMSDAQKCENNRYCFYDRSYSTIDSCFGCDPSMSCYDYKTEETCTRDNCKVRNCKWRYSTDNSNQIGIGACVSTSQSNCQWCGKKGTENLENSKSYNEIFDLCSEDKSKALSVKNFNCYFKDGASNDCAEITCADYENGQCSSSPIGHDPDNKLTNPSQDECGIQVCQNMNGACAKNADGDENPDCENAESPEQAAEQEGTAETNNDGETTEGQNKPECEKDYFMPNTNLLTLKKKGIADTIIIHIYDKTMFGGASVLTTSSDYATYLCVEPCGASGHPYEKSTKSRKIIVSGLSAYDSDNGEKILSLNEGANNIRYYSQDPSKNIGRVKILALEAYSKISPPKVQSVEVTNGQILNGRIITNSQQPTITVKFFEPAVITFARLAGDSGIVIPLSFGNELSTQAAVTVPQTLKDGTYKLEINAKNDKNLFMDGIHSVKIAVDTAKPLLTLKPANGESIETSAFDIVLTLNEEGTLDYVTMNSEPIKEPFSSLDNKVFTAKLNLPDGNKVLEASASDLAKNKVAGSSSFAVDAKPMQITLTSPKFGVSPRYSFALTVETDNNAQCKYNLDDDAEFDFMTGFDSTRGIVHSIKNFNDIFEPDTDIHKLYVKCSDKRGITSASFDLSIDNSAPIIKSSFAFPNPIVEKPITTRFTIETDEPSLCKYSALANTKFEDMDGKFEDYDKTAFRTINRKSVTVEKDGEYAYYAACMNRAGLESETVKIVFSVILDSLIRIKSHTREFFNTTAATLAIETNKKSQCKYSETDRTGQTGKLFGASGYSHTAQFESPMGDHIFYIICKDQSLQKWSDVFQVKFYVDTTVPLMLYVNDTSAESFPAEKTCNTDKLRVKYLGEDMDSGIKDYFYTILKDNKPIINDVNSFQGGDWFWAENLKLQDNAQYFFSVRTRNHAGLSSTNKLSDGITVDTSLCGPGKRCGDGVINQAGEECDGTTFGVIKSCLDYTNFVGGTLKCIPANSPNSCKLDISECTKMPNCGNGLIDPGEMCDGTKFGSVDSCSKFSASFSGGSLKCTQACQLDTTGCTEKPKCGNGVIEQGESCDGTNIGQISGKCTDYSSTFTDGAITCNACKLDTSGCKGASAGTCGDGLIKIGEACDGTTFGQIKSCTDFSVFNGGSLKCAPITCQLDTTGCTEKPKCGNAYIDPGESCDTNNIIPASGKCLDYSSDFGDGSLKCTSCKLDTIDCKKAPACGNDKIDADESCDGTKFKTANTDCSSYSSTFASGTLACKNCRISTDNCVSNTVITPVIPCKDKGTCQVNDACSGNSECQSRFCFGGKCKEATCSDGIKNQDEADTDCGGPCSAKCLYGKSCKISSDCQSNFCSGSICKETEACSDEKLSPNEADIDCGGACPDKCSQGSSCNDDNDCKSGLACVSAECKFIEDTEPTATDTDGDGLPDEWEISNGLDPNDPNDANIDTDNDGLTNREEYELQKTFQGIDPRKSDTDEDGYSDKKEVDSSTSPIDPLSFPKSSLVKILLFVLGAIVLISGFGYLAYVTVEKRREKEFEMPGSKPQTRSLSFIPPPQQIRQQPFAPRQDFRARLPMANESIKAREMRKDMERKNLFTGFGGIKTDIKPAVGQKPQKQADEAKTQPAKIEKKAKRAKQPSGKKPPVKAKPREDVFAKLKEIAQEKKKPRKP